MALPSGFHRSFRNTCMVLLVPSYKNDKSNKSTPLNSLRFDSASQSAVSLSIVISEMTFCYETRELHKVQSPKDHWRLAGMKVNSPQAASSSPLLTISKFPGKIT